MTRHIDATPEMYRQIFEVDVRGMAVLEDMVRRFSKPAQLEGGIDAVINTYHRMGEQAVIQHIIRQINMANGAEPGENDDPIEVEIAG